MALLVKIGADLKSFDKELNRAMYDIKGLTNKLQDVGKTLTMSVTVPLTALAGISVKTAADFDSSMNKVSAISGATGDDLQELREKAKEMGATTSKSASESAEAMSYMAMAGWKTTDMLDGLEGILRLSEASGADLATTSDIVTDALTAFGMSAKESGDFADLLASTSSNANTNVEMLGESFKYVAPLFGAMGYSAEDASLALGLMANAGIKGSQAGTSLKTAITNLAKPSKKMQAAIDDLGLSLTDSSGDMKSFEEIMGDMRLAFKDLTPEQQASYAATIFGKEAMSGMLAIVNASEDDFNKLTDATRNYEGSATSMAETTQGGLNGSLTELKSKLEGVAIEIGEKLMPLVEGFVEFISGLVDNFNNLSPAMQDVILIIAGFAAALGPILLIVATLIKLKTLWATASSTLVFANTALSMSILALIGWIVLIVAAIAAVIGIIVYLWQTNETFREFILTCWEAIKTFFVATWEIIQAVAISVWEYISEFCMTIWNAISEVAMGIFNRLKEFWNENQESIMEIISAVWNFISGLLTGIWNVIQIVAETIFNALKSFWDTWGESIMAAFEFIWNIIKDVLEGVWEKMKGIFEAGLKFWSGIFDTFAGLFTGNWEKMWGGVEKIFSGIWDGIKSMFGNGINIFIRTINGFIGGLNRVKLPDFMGGFGINIPMIPEVALAKGGIVTRPTVALTGEAGPEAVIPLNRLKEFIGGDNDNKNAEKQKTSSDINLKIDNFYNNTDNDIEKIADELAYLIKRKNIAFGG